MKKIAGKGHRVKKMRGLGAQKELVKAAVEVGPMGRSPFYSRIERDMRLEGMQLWRPKGNLKYQKRASSALEANVIFPVMNGKRIRGLPFFAAVEKQIAEDSRPWKNGKPLPWVRVNWQLWYFGFDNLDFIMLFPDRGVGIFPWMHMMHFSRQGDLKRFMSWREAGCPLPLRPSRDQTFSFPIIYMFPDTCRTKKDRGRMFIEIPHLFFRPSPSSYERAAATTEEMERQKDLAVKGIGLKLYVKPPAPKVPFKHYFNEEGILLFIRSDYHADVPVNPLAVQMLRK